MENENNLSHCEPSQSEALAGRGNPCIHLPINIKYYEESNAIATSFACAKGYGVTPRNDGILLIDHYLRSFVRQMQFFNRAFLTREVKATHLRAFKGF